MIISLLVGGEYPQNISHFYPHDLHISQTIFRNETKICESLWMCFIVYSFTIYTTLGSFLVRSCHSESYLFDFFPLNSQTKRRFEDVLNNKLWRIPLFFLSSYVLIIAALELDRMLSF